MSNINVIYWSSKLYQIKSFLTEQFLQRTFAIRNETLEVAMNKYLTRLALTTVFLFGLTLSSSSAEAQIFGADDEDLKKIYFELKKFNAHLAEVKNQVLDEIHQQNKILQLFRQEQANLKEGLAQDMEKFEQNIGSIKAVLTTDLIPALRNENNKTRQSMLGEIEKLKFSQNRLEGKLDELLRKMGFEKLESWDIYK